MMQILDEYISELSQDVKIDEFSMKDVQMKLPAIKHKWTGRLIRTKLEIDDNYREKSKLVRNLADMLIKESPVTIGLPLALKKVEDHQKVRDINDKIKRLRLTVEFLEKAERILNSVTFDIKNLVEIIKLETL